MKRNGIRAALIRVLGGVVPPGAEDRPPVASAKRIIRTVGAQEGFYHHTGMATTMEEHIEGVKLRCLEKIAGILMRDNLVEYEIDRATEHVIVTAKVRVLDPRTEGAK